MHISRQSKSFRASLAKQLETKLSEIDSNDDNELNVSEVVAFGKDLKMNREQRDTLLGTLLNPAESPRSELGDLSHNLNTFLGTLAGPAEPPQSESVKSFYQLNTSGSASRLSMLAKAESSPRNYLTLSGNILDDLRASGNTKAKEIIESAEVGALAFEFGEMLKDALSSVPLEDGHLTPTALNALAKKVFGNDADEDLLNTFISTALAPVEDKEGYWTLATVNGAQARVQMHLDHFANDADPDNRLADMMRSAHARVNEAALLFGPDVTLGKIAATSVQLQKDIKGLEAANKAKMGEIDRLVRDIESRKADLKREYNNKRNIGIFAIFAGVPAVGALSLIEMQRDDARLNRLEKDLREAKSDQSNAASKLKSYKAFKSKISRKLDALEAQKTLGALPQETPAALEAALSGLEDHAMAESQKNVLKKEVALLTSLRDEAKALGVDLDAVLASLEVKLERAERALEASEKATDALIDIMLEDDPQSAALKKLRKMAKAEVKKIVNNMLSKHNLPQELEDKLRTRFMNALLPALG